MEDNKKLDFIRNQVEVNIGSAERINETAGILMKSNYRDANHFLRGFEAGLKAVKDIIESTDDWE